MRIILVVDDMYPETWTLLNQPGLNDGNSTNFWIDAEVIPLQSSEEALPSSIYSFDQMKHWQVKEETMDGLFVACVKYDDSEYCSPDDEQCLEYIESLSDSSHQAEEQKKPAASIIGSRKLKIEDNDESSAVGICAANCKLQNEWCDMR